MADLNALLQNVDSVPTVPTGGMVQVNPLAAISAGNQAAQQEYQTRGLQAQQAIGQIIQQSTDENGNVDWQGAHKAAAAAGPIVQMGMMKFAGDASTLRTQQLENAAATNGLFASQAMTLMNNPGDDNVHAVFANLKAKGMPADMVAREEARFMAMSEAQRQAEAYREGNAHLSALDQMARSPYAMPESVDTGAGGRRPVQTVPPSPYGPGGARVLGGGVTTGPQPGQTTPSVEPFDEQGQIPRDANGVPTRTPKTWQPTTVPVTTVPGVPRGGAQIGPGGGGGQGPAPRGSAPSVTVPPPPAGNTSRPSAPPPGTGAGGGGGGAGGVTQPPPPPPATQPPTGGAGGSGPPIVTAPPQGQPEKLKADVEAYTQDQAALPTTQTRVQNLSHAYEALSQMKSATGKGAGGINSLRSWAQTLGIAPAGAVEEQKLMELVTKYTEREMINAAGGSTTDMGRRMQEQANAGTLLSAPANFDILRNDMGKAIQNIAAYQDHTDKTGNGYLEHRADVASVTDPRGFVWNMYSPEEQAKIQASVKPGSADDKKLHKAIGMAARLNLGGSLSPPPADKRSSLVPPPMPQQNPLTMTG